MPATTNWSEEQRARAKALHEARLAERRAKEAQAAADEAEEIAAIRRQMEDMQRRLVLALVALAIIALLTDDT